MFFTDNEMHKVWEAFGPESHFGKLAPSEVKVHWEELTAYDPRVTSPDEDVSLDTVRMFLFTELKEESLYTQDLEPIVYRLFGIGYDLRKEFNWCFSK
jgi:hypothetical protein